MSSNSSSIIVEIVVVVGVKVVVVVVYECQQHKNRTNIHSQNTGISQPDT